MGLRDRNSESLCDDRENYRGSDLDWRIFADGSAGLPASVSTIVSADDFWIGIFALPGAYRKRHSGSVVRLLRDLIGNNFAADAAGAGDGAGAMAAAKACGIRMN